MSEANLDEEDRDDVMYSFQQGYTAIEAWKAHQLRAIKQDKACSNIIDTLAESSVLITQDSYAERETCNTKHLSTLRRIVI